MTDTTTELTPAPTTFTLADVVAGVSVALVLIPQSLAYAEIAGLPTFHGLFAAALPLVAMSLIASSPYLQTGPVAMTSLLTFGTLSVIEAPGSTEYIALAALLAVMVGVTRLLLGALRLGRVVYLMTRPVVRGFTTAAAILIVSSQVPNAFASTPPEGGLLWRAGWTLVHPGSWEPAAVGISLVTALFVLGGRRVHTLFPGVLAAVVVSIGFSVLTEYSGPVVGDVPAGLPPLSVDLPWSRVPELFVGAVVIALVGFAEPAAIARLFARQERQIWNASRDFLSSGLANITSGLSGGFPVGGSFSRSSVNKMAGARSRWAGAVTGFTVLAFLPVAGVLEPLPRAVLGAIVVSAVGGLIRIDRIIHWWNVTTVEGVTATVTFVATLGFAPRIERGVIVGVIVGSFALWWKRRFLVDIGDGTDGGP